MNEIGLVGEENAAGAAIAGALRAAGHEVGPPSPACAVLVDAASATPPVRDDVLPSLLELASRSGARMVLISSVLVYGDAGEDWIEAAEPVIDPAPGFEGLPSLELSVFASAARFLVLRAGVLGPAPPGAAKRGSRCSGRPTWAPGWSARSRST